MKKLLTFLFALLLIAPIAEVQAQNKALEKALKKEFKEKKKEFKKGGWKIYGTSRSEDVVLLKHFDKLAALDEDGVEIVGIASNFKSKNVGVQMAYNNAVVSHTR